MKNKIIKRILITLFLISLTFIALIIYLNVFLFKKGKDYQKLSYNRRTLSIEQSIKRGNITDRTGKILAESVPVDKVYKRRYNFPKTYSHIIGYVSLDYGKAGLEQAFNNQLIGMSGTSIDEIKKIAGIKQGNGLRLSIDHELEVFAREVLVDRKGAILSMDLKTGDLLCMASYPDFNSNTIAEDWKWLIEKDNAPLLNRATQGLYAPGSIFKIITTDALLSTINPLNKYKSTGVTTIDGYKIHDAKKSGYGEINLFEAFAFSSNTYYATMGQEISEEQWNNSINKFRLNKDTDFDLPVKKPKVEFKNLSKTEKAALSIGQGKTLVTPLSMLEAVSIVANNGNYVKPRLVNAIIYPNGKVSEIPVKIIESKEKNNYNELQEMMVKTVREGTATNAQIDGINVAGKTGTSENATGKSHAWFVGYAPMENPEVAVCVLLESEGSSGGVAAAPIARKILQKSLKIKEE